MSDQLHKFTPPQAEFFTRYAPGEFQGTDRKAMILQELSNVDLHEQGFITPVRQQFPCDASCTAFAFAAVIESYYLTVEKTNPEVAAGWIHTCSSNLDCANGANPEGVRDRLSEQYVPLAEQGPFPWTDSYCSVPCDIYVPLLDPYSGDEEIKYALQNGTPVAAAMAIDWAFVEWVGSNPYEVDFRNETFGHVATIVGYDDNFGGWIVKNSFGEGWGDKGYFYAPYRSSGIGDYPAFGLAV